MEGNATVVVENCIVGLELYGAVLIFQCLLIPVHFVEGSAATVVKSCIVGLELYSAVGILQRLLIPAHIVEDCTAVVVGHCIIRLQPDGFIVFLQRSFQLAHAIKLRSFGQVCIIVRFWVAGFGCLVCLLLEDSLLHSGILRGSVCLRIGGVRLIFLP